MDEGYDALSEKEKETLRLMVRGHDAKSMARELSLSVHTINERLREARRKLSVTSSREAARLLLEREGGTPENLAYKQLGDVDEAMPGEKPSIAYGRFAGRLIGGVSIMVILFAAGLLLTSQIDEPAREEAQVDVPASDVEVVNAARTWLALTDAGDWQKSFDTAGRSFREVNTVSGWTKAANGVRTPLGELVSRELLTVRYLNAPPRGYQEVAFSTRYANSDKAIIETLTLQQEDGEWKVVGILVD